MASVLGRIATADTHYPASLIDIVGDSDVVDDKERRAAIRILSFVTADLKRVVDAVLNVVRAEGGSE